LNKIESKQFETRTGTIWNSDRHSTSRAAGLSVLMHQHSALDGIQRLYGPLVGQIGGARLYMLVFL